MNKYVLLSVALLAATPTMQTAPSAMNPKYLLPAILGVQGEHLNPFNLAQNMLPELAVQKAKDALVAELGNATPDKKSAQYKLAQTTEHVVTETAAKYPLTFLTPIGRRAPANFSRSLTQQIASVMRFVMPTLDTQGKKLDAKFHPAISQLEVLAAAIQHLPELVYRRNIANKLAKKGIAVSSWSVPKHMRGRKYLMFHGPLGYLVKHLFAFADLTIGIGNITYNTAKASGSSLPQEDKFTAVLSKYYALFPAGCVLTAAQMQERAKTPPAGDDKNPEDAMLRTLLPLLSLTPKYYILESDFKKLSSADKIAVYQAVYEDVTAFSDKLAQLVAPSLTKQSWDDAVALGKAVKADPKKVAQEKWDAAQTKAKAQWTAFKKKINDFTA